MIFDVLTIFPDLLKSPLQEGIIRRAVEGEKVHINIINIRDFATDKHAMTDDRPYGGGEGMVMKPEPLASSIRYAKEGCAGSRVILLSPQGKQYTQEQATRLASYHHLIMICGRYEGVDDRIREGFVDEEISIGDYILTGGELAAMILIDSITRLLPGSLGCADSVLEDTFTRGCLKYPQYTRPRNFEGKIVPEVLLSGNHEKIAEWRFVSSMRQTKEKRPDIFSKLTFSKKEITLLKKFGIA